jgi:hypothetical protein
MPLLPPSTFLSHAGNHHGGWGRGRRGALPRGEAGWPPPLGGDHAVQGACASGRGPYLGGGASARGGRPARRAPSAHGAGALACLAACRSRCSMGEQGGALQGLHAGRPGPGRDQTMRNEAKQRTWMEEFTWEEDSRRSRGWIRRLTEIRRFDRRTECTETKPSTRQTQRYPRIPPTTHGLEVIAHQSWNCSKLRQAISGDGEWIWENCFMIQNVLSEEKSAIYIYS